MEERRSPQPFDPPEGIVVCVAVGGDFGGSKKPPPLANADVLVVWGAAADDRGLREERASKAEGCCAGALGWLLRLGEPLKLREPNASSNPPRPDWVAAGEADAKAPNAPCCDCCCTG